MLVVVLVLENPNSFAISRKAVGDCPTARRNDFLVEVLFFEKFPCRGHFLHARGVPTPGVLWWFQRCWHHHRPMIFHQSPPMPSQITILITLAIAPMVHQVGSST